LRSLDDARPQYEAKLLLVGRGNVGKTSLVAALRGAPFVEGRPTTHGIEIWPLTFHHPSLDVDMTLRAWDFGGQDVYQVTHQFFFTPHALYVVIWNARQGPESDDVEGWLSRISLRIGPDARTIVVATHCAERIPDLDYDQLKNQFAEMLFGSFEVDNRTGEGIPELREAISQQAAQLSPMGQMISPRWTAARDEILARKDIEPQIRYEEFAQACERHGVTGQEILTLAQLMHDIGHIIYYGDDEGLKDVVVLNPEWLTKAISYVLGDKQTKDAGGVLDHGRLKDIWREREDRPAYPARYHPYFLRLMEKFDISYRLDGDESHSLVAQLVPHNRPALPWQAGEELESGKRRLALICRLEEPAPGLIPWLTVRHYRASTGMSWRRGVFLRYPIVAYASEALLELHGSRTLAVEVRAPSPDFYFSILRDSIEDLITRRWPGLKYEFLIPCPYLAPDGSRCAGMFPLDGLLRIREGDQTTSVQCLVCTEFHQISFRLTGFAAPEQPLVATMAQIRDQMTQMRDEINAGFKQMAYQGADIARTVRQVQRAASQEVTDCPHIFTLVPGRSNVSKLLHIHQNHFRLTLWCEYPGYMHPWDPASYDIDPPKEWFTRIMPYAKVIVTMLQLAVPAAGTIGTLLPREQLELAREYVDVMNTFVDELSAETNPDVAGVSLSQAAGRLNMAEGRALRALRTVVFEHDRLHGFGGLRRVRAESGDFLWVCEDHYTSYDPGLPAIP
jgi:GTPase SAR1 family protein